jgi:L-aspartate oxidase
MSERLGDDFDVVIVGSGVAGLSVALRLAPIRRVAIVTSGGLGGGSTALAQGGVAASLDPADSPLLHAADTVAAGAGLCDADVVRRIVEAAPVEIRELVEVGAVFDRDADGVLALTREGGHRCSRVVHAGGDATGAEISRALVAAVRATSTVIFEHTEVLDLHLALGRSGRQVAGVRLRRAGGAAGGELVAAREVVLATGGVGGLYAATTNPPEVTAAGLGLALRAGAALVDVEFVQFHPTGLRLPGTRRVPLLSEALRGEGAVLRDRAGRRIMAGHHPMADLAPRDVVARRIVEVMSEQVDGEPNQVGLDATGFGRDGLAARFPTAYRICAHHDIDPATEPIPVAPTEHFLCGGIRTDQWGRTDVVGLSAVGEAAATGIHGANRLASNSLLEGLVVGRRLARRLVVDLPSRAVRDTDQAPVPAVGAEAVARLQAVMSRDLGVIRTEAGLAAAADDLAAMLGAGEPSLDAGHRWLAARAVVAAATAREESRGCHWRADFPGTDERWRHRLLVSVDDDGRPTVGAAVPLEESA